MTLQVVVDKVQRIGAAPLAPYSSSPANTKTAMRSCPLMTLHEMNAVRDLYDNPLGCDGFEFVEFISLSAPPNDRCHRILDSYLVG